MIPVTVATVWKTIGILVWKNVFSLTCVPPAPSHALCKAAAGGNCPAASVIDISRNARPSCALVRTSALQWASEWRGGV